MTVLLDTDILSFFFRGEPEVVARFRSYVEQHGKIHFSIISYYEILSGLRHRDASRQLELFLRFASENEVVPPTKASVDRSAQLYADLRSEGKPLDDIDLLIAGIALAGDMMLATHNVKHFSRISGLTIEDWTEPFEPRPQEGG